MALHHAAPLDVISLKPQALTRESERSHSLLRTDDFQLIHIALGPGDAMPEHTVAGPLTLQCLEGEAEVVTPRGTCGLKAGELVMLPGGEPHAVRSAGGGMLLLTLVRRPDRD
jgi:quercetin dioxygenase-like cupin family protein